MRRADHVRVVHERMVRRRRLFDEDVEPGGADLARVEGFEEGFLVDDPAAGGVDHDQAWLRLRELGGAEDPRGVLRLRNVDGHDVGAAHHLVELDALDLEARGGLFRQIGIVDDHLHAEALGPGHDEAADVARPEDAEGPVVELHPLKLLLLPLSGLHRGRGLRDVPREGDDQRDRVLRRRDVVAFGRVDDDDAVLGRRVDVDVVHTDPGATDDPEVLRGGEHVARHLRARADGQAVDVGDQLEQRVRRDAGAVDDLDARGLFEDRHALVGEGIGNEDFRHPSVLQSRSDPGARVRSARITVHAVGAVPSAQGVRSRRSRRADSSVSGAHERPSWSILIGSDRFDRRRRGRRACDVPRASQRGPARESHRAK